MSKQWIPGVKNTKQLAVFSELGGRYATVFKKALDEANRLVKNLGVKLVPVKGKAEANVIMRTASGPIDFEYDDKKETLAFNPNILHGKTRLISRTDNADVEKAFVYVPANPQMSAPAGLRPAGNDVLTFIAVHELIHACGLEDGDHSTNGVFYYNPAGVPGDSAAQDKVMVIQKLSKTQLKQTLMPPLFLEPAAASLIKDSWA